MLNGGKGKNEHRERKKPLGLEIEKARIYLQPKYFIVCVVNADKKCLFTSVSTRAL